MINRTLSRRLQKLEDRLIPNDEPIVIHIKYVSPDGTVKDGTIFIRNVLTHAEYDKGKWK